MKRFTSIDEFSASNSESTIVTIGNFDGCHNGHKLLIQEVKKLAVKNNAKPIALTFSPSPKQFFGVLDKSDRIFNDEIKLTYFEKCNLFAAVNQRFDNKFANISDVEFIENELLKKLNAVGLVVGKNFRFGHQAVGSSKTLRKYFSDKPEFDLAIINHETTDSESVISSTMIRSLIREAQLSRACELLSRPHLVSAKVVHGKKLGNTIGFPTANLSNVEQILPKDGVYSGWLALDENFDFNEPLKNAFKAVANIGTNPTTDRCTSKKFEVHVLNRNDLNLYDKNVWFIFNSFIREEKKFNSLDDLVKQIRIDCQKAEESLRK